jgi:uncharacterized protein YacL (UPF0231 family)
MKNRALARAIERMNRDHNRVLELKNNEIDLKNNEIKAMSDQIIEKRALHDEEWAAWCAEHAQLKDIESSRALQMMRKIQPIGAIHNQRH